MISRLFQRLRHTPPALRNHLIPLIFACFVLACAGILAMAQSGSQQPQQPPTNPNQQEAPPEAGGPQSDIGPYVIPKKKEEPPPPAPEKPKKIENMPDYAIKVDVPLVSLDVLVTTKDGQTIAGLKQENFKVLEDGTPQIISSFNQTQGPITAVLLIEYASTNMSYMYDALNASYSFASGLKKDDWVAVVSYDLKPQILVDFTQDKRAIMGALNMLRIPGMAERDLFDALFDTIDRIDRIEGKKYVILVSSGADTFSKLTYDQIMKKVKATKDVTIYPISIGWVLRERLAAGGYAGPSTEVGWLQNDNRAEHFCQTYWRACLLPALPRRIAGDLWADLIRHSQPVHHRVSPHEYQTRRHLSQIENRVGGS